MTPRISETEQRRTVLKLLGAVAGASTLGSVVHARTSSHDGDGSVVVEQGDRCVEVFSLSGDEPVEAFYDYRYPTEDFESVSGSNGYSYSSEGTTHLQKDATSILFLYDGPRGLSLVVVHGRLADAEEEGDDGGVVTFTFDGMPADASWVVRDDYYLVDGKPADTNFDRWDVDGTHHQVDWAYKGGRTDGGAALGLGEEFEVTITPAFNDEATLAPDHQYKGPIDAWEALTWGGESPDRVSLRMDEPITIHTGSCEESTDDEPTDTPDDEPDDAPDGVDGEAGEGDSREGCR